MIRILERKTFTSTNKNVVEGKDYVEIACLSTDTKPTTGIATGSSAFEVDTGDVYFFDEESGEWLGDGDEE